MDVINFYLLRYFSRNEAARMFKEQGIDYLGIHLYAMIDHMTFRTNNVVERAKEFEQLGYRAFGERINAGTWWLQAFRHTDFVFPTIVIDQPDYTFEHTHDGGSIIDDWVREFGDTEVHHVAFRVKDIRKTAELWQGLGIPINWDSFAEDTGTGLKQIFTVPQEKNGKPHTVLEFIERPLECNDLVVANTNKLILSTEKK